MRRDLTLEEQNDILDAKANTTVKPTSEDVYASMMMQQAIADGHRSKLPRGPKKEAQATLNIIKRVVDVITKHGPVTATELAAHLGIDRNSVHSYLTPAKRNGLVERDPNSTKTVFRLKEPKT